MTKPAIYIRCMDEGHGPVNPMPDELEQSTALMINPSASLSVLLDAASARASRIVDITQPFLDLETQSFEFSREEACRLLTTLGAMAYEVCRLLMAAQAESTGKVEVSHE